MLLGRCAEESRASADVRQMAEAARRHRRIADLQGLRSTLADLLRRCHGDDHSDCPVLDDLAHEKP